MNCIILILLLQHLIVMGWWWEQSCKSGGVRIKPGAWEVEKYVVFVWWSEARDEERKRVLKIESKIIELQKTFPCYWKWLLAQMCFTRYSIALFEQNPFPHRKIPTPFPILFNKKYSKDMCFYCNLALCYSRKKWFLECLDSLESNCGFWHLCDLLLPHCWCQLNRMIHSQFCKRILMFPISWRPS